MVGSTGGLSRRRALMALLVAGGSTIPLGLAVAEARRSDLQPAPGDYMGAGLRRQVEDLKADVARTPTDDRNYRDRGYVLYDWMNAFSMTGAYLHPDLPSLIAGLYSPGFPNNGERARQRSQATLDQFVRTLAALEANPAICGKVAARTQGTLYVDTFVQFQQTYTVGDAPIAAGGGVILPNHFYFASEELQATDPKADNYVSVRSSNPALRFVRDTFPIAGMFSSRLGVTEAPRVFFRLEGGELRKGDRLTVTYGDQSEGSRGLKLIHVSNSALRFPMWIMTAADGLLLTPREAHLPVLGGRVSGVHGFGPSVAAAGEPVEISIRAEDKFRNLATGGAPGWTLRLDGQPLRRLPASKSSISRVALTFDKPGVYRIAITSDDGRIAGVCDPVVVEAEPKERVYWGETHGHCGFSEGMGRVDDYFLFARDESRLDFVTLSEHDLWLDASEWEQMRTAVRRFDDPGRFTTFMGYEWTVVAAFGGHHNVVYRNIEGVTPVACQRHPSLPDLYRGLRRAYDPKDVVVIPHAHMTGDAAQNDPELEPLVEIVSQHGTFEWLGRRYLASGFQLGFVGASDDHIGHPGYKARPLGRYYFDGYGGLAAVYAAENRRDAIFDAMKSRRTYATNGARIVLRCTLNGQPMGQVLEPARMRTIEGRVHGTAPIESITLVKNGVETQTLAYDNLEAGAAGDLVEVRFASTSDPGAPLIPSRQIRAWAGRLVIEGAEIEGAASPQVEALNTLTEWVRPDPADPAAVTFRLVTRGDSKAIRLKLKGDLSAARIRVELPEARVPLDARGAVPAAGAPPLIIGAPDRAPGGERTSGGEFMDRIQVRRIRPAAEPDRPFRFVDEAATEGDSYYVRVTQADGGQAWSSPGWLGQPRRRA